MQKSKKYKALLKNDVVWFSNPDDVKYLTNFSSSNMHVFYIDKKWFALTDMRYFEAAKKQIKNMEIFLLEKDAFNKKIIPKINKISNEIVIDSDYTSISTFENITKKLAKKNIKFKPISYLGLREIKNDKEINDLKIAAGLTDDIFKKVLLFIKSGLTERDVSIFLEKEILDLNSKKSFEPIVAAGKNGAEPHHKNSDYIIKKGDMVTIDFGLYYKDMCSDMTRTIVIGKEPTTEEKKIYEITKNALNKAINYIKPGKICSDVDKVARDYIKKQGYGKYFTHGLGHGIGIAIHEEPRLNSISKKKLEKGMVVTIEPGIYIPNKYGVRIEQDVVVTEKNCKILNKTTIDMVVV